MKYLSYNSVYECLIGILALVLVGIGGCICLDRGLYLWPYYSLVRHGGLGDGFSLSPAHSRCVATVAVSGNLIGVADFYPSHCSEKAEGWEGKD